jgi:hypothetical protein
MKRILLWLFLLLTTVFYAQAPDITMCSGEINLNTQKALLIGNLNPAETTVSYHLSLADATNNANAIPNPSNYVPKPGSTTTIYARIDNKGTITTSSFKITVFAALNVIATNTPVTCKGSNTGTITINTIGGRFPLSYSIDGGTDTQNSTFTNLAAGNYTINVHDMGCKTVLINTTVESYKPIKIIPLTATPTCNGESNGQIQLLNTTGGISPYTYSLRNYTTGNATGQYSTNIFYNVGVGTYIVEAADASGCKEIAFVEMTEPTRLLGVAAIENQNSVVLTGTGGYGSYTYAVSPKLYEFSTNNRFTNLEPGNYTYIIQEPSGCSFTSNFVINPVAPSLNGKTAIVINFILGQTLRDIKIDGENIKWYSSKNPLTGKTKKTSETSLPLTTVLEDGTTYYASQTINGIESTERLALTVKSDALGTDDFVIKDFTFYPNPLKGILTISNTSIINEVILSSINGVMLLTKQINALRSEIDLSHFSSGIYLLKIKSEGTEKTVKLIKE